ncbi:OmpA/MotB family protein [Microbacterium sp. gxy059]|uniref:OmpA/MotB family protein n=1 Tax=Microbacterium sp. gxy059 TaxID=2957199 RepID=UPI003D99B096
MRTFSRRRAAAPDEEPSYWISFSDMMSGLLVIFILAAAALMLQLMQRQSEVAAILETQQEQERQFSAQVRSLSDSEVSRAQMLGEVRDSLVASGIEVVLNADSSVLSIPISALGFASGSADIPDANEETALRIGQALSQVMNDQERAAHLDTVFVEGHTDGVPYDQPGGNWRLSTDRAIALWQLWESGLPDAESLDALTNASGRPLFSVSGYADTRPVEGTPAGAVDHPPNRRIDIRITVVAPTSDELEGILDAYRDGETD